MTNYSKNLEKSGNNRFTCPCCGYKTLESGGDYRICEICFWEDDPFQMSHPDSSEGSNQISLSEARQNFVEFGAIQKKFLITVRKPTKADIKDPKWRSAKYFINDDFKMNTVETLEL